MKSKNNNAFLTTSFKSAMILECVTNSKATALYHSLAIVLRPIRNPVCWWTGFKLCPEIGLVFQQAVFHPSPRPPPLAHIVNSLPGPDLAARIQDGDLITNFGFFRPSNRLRAG